MKEKSHFNNLIKDTISICPHCHCSHLPVTVVVGSNYFLLTNLQMGPIALSTLIPEHFLHILGVILLCLFLNLWHHKLSFFPLNFPLKRSITAHLILPEDSNHRCIREHDQWQYRVPSANRPRQISHSFHWGDVQYTDYLQGPWNNSLNPPLCILLCRWGVNAGRLTSCWQDKFQCVLSPHFRVRGAWHSRVFSSFPSDWSSSQLFS